LQESQSRNHSYCRIESVGAFLPRKSLTTTEIMRSLRIPGSLKFELLTGIKSRNICQEGEDSLSLSLAAARKCLEHSAILADDIEAVISCSITRYKGGYHQLYEPSMSFHIKEGIGASRALYFDISNACAGMFTGILAAQNLIRQGSIKNCLVVSGEYISSLIDHAVRNVKTPASQELASLTVGDAGAAIMIQATNNKDESITLSGFETLSRYNDLCTAQPHPRYPGASMKTKAKKIHEVSIRESLPLVKDALRTLGIEYSNIDYLIPHQTSRSAILSGSRKYSATFGGQPKQVVINLSENGNTASTTHFVTLFQLLQKNTLKPDDLIFLISYASGIAFGIIAFKPKHLIVNYGS
jgi:3-oxoacyl-[acyl-carrier-protein] synthase III